MVILIIEQNCEGQNTFFYLSLTFFALFWKNYSLTVIEINRSPSLGSALLERRLPTIQRIPSWSKRMGILSLSCGGILASTNQSLSFFVPPTPRGLNLSPGLRVRT